MTPASKAWVHSSAEAQADQIDGFEQLSSESRFYWVLSGSRVNPNHI